MASAQAPSPFPDGGMPPSLSAERKFPQDLVSWDTRQLPENIMGPPQQGPIGAGQVKTQVVPGLDSPPATANANKLVPDSAETTFFEYEEVVRFTIGENQRVHHNSKQKTSLPCVTYLKGKDGLRRDEEVFLSRRVLLLNHHVTHNNESIWKKFQVTTYMREDTSCVPAALSSDFRFFAQAVDDMVEVFLVSGGNVFRTLDLPSATRLNSLSFSAGGDILVGCINVHEDPRLVVWSVITGDLIKNLGADGRHNFFEPGSTVCGSVSEDKKFIYCVERPMDPGLRETHSKVHAFPLRAASANVTDSDDPAAELVGELTGEAQEFREPGDVDPSSTSFFPIQPFQRFVSGYIDGELVSLDRHRVARGSAQKKTKAHSIATMELYHRHYGSGDNERPPLFGQFANAGDIFALVFQANHEISVFNVGTPAYEGLDFCVHVPNPNTVVVWSVSGEELLHTFEHQRRVTCLKVSEDCSVMAVGVSGNSLEADGSEVARCMSEVVIYSLITFQKVHSFAVEYDVESASLVFDPTNRILRLRFVDTNAHGEKKTATIDLGDTDELQPESEPANDPELSLGFRRAEKVAMSSDRYFFVSFRREGRASLLTLGCVRDKKTKHGYGTDFYLVPRYRLVPASMLPPNPAVAPSIGEHDTEVGSETQAGSKTAPLTPILESFEVVRGGNPSPEAARVTVTCVAMSGWGTTIGVGLTVVEQTESGGAGAGKKRRHFVVVLGGALLQTLMLVELAQRPKAISIRQELVSVLADSSQAESYAESECSLTTFDLYTGEEINASKVKATGRTLGIAWHGQHLRIGQHPDKRIFIESTDTGEIMFEMQDRTLSFRGADATGRQLVLQHAPDVKRGENFGKLFIKNLENMEVFGPSAMTTMSWFGGGKGNPPSDLAEVQLTIARLKDGLAKWPVLFTEQWSVVFTRLLNLCIENRDYGPFKVLIESCPYFWAGTMYLGDEPETCRKKREEAGCDQEEIDHLLALEDCCTKDRYKANSDPPQTFWSKALQNNDKILVQMLLDGVLQMVKEKPKEVPVQAMEQVTDFVVGCIERNRMSDKIEAFLTNLPLLSVSNETIQGEETVFTDFPDGGVLNTAWHSRHVQLSATAWSYKVDEQSKKKKTSADLEMAVVDGLAMVGNERGERGYRYVSVLPGLTKSEVIAAFTSENASPALVDNETMRATIDSLVETTTERLVPFANPSWWNISWDWTLTLYVGTLISFCLLVYYTATWPEPFSEMMEISSRRFGFRFGVVALVGHILFLFFECIEFATIPGESMRQRFKNYFFSAWNLLPVVGNVLGVSTFFMVVGDEDKERTRAIAACGMIFLWANLFNYLRAYRKGSALVAMLVEIVKDMLYFVGVVAVLIFGFAGGFFALSGHLDPEELGLQNENTCIEEPEDNDFMEISTALSRTFLMSILGDFDVDALRNPLDLTRGEGGGMLTNLTFLFFFLLVLLISVVALNALIALMGSTYGRVEQTSQGVTYKEIFSITYDKLRFRYFTGMTDQSQFERDNRWTHVLSSSEYGSMPQVRGARSGNQLAELQMEVRTNQKSNEKQLAHIMGLLDNQEELLSAKVGELGDGGTNAVLASLSENVASVSTSQKEMRSVVSAVAKCVGADTQHPAVPAQQSSGREEGDTKLSELVGVVQSLQKGFFAQAAAFEQITARLDNKGLLAAAAEP